LVGEKFTDSTHTAAAEMVNIIQETVTLAELEEVTEGGDDVLSGEDAHVRIGLKPEFLIDLVTTHPCEVIALRIKEQTLHERPSVWHGRRITGAKAAIDLLECFVFITRRIFAEGGDE
jgi:hypothetical protein